MVINIRHTGIVVEDLDKSLEFYINKLGFKIDDAEDGSKVSKL